MRLSTRVQELFKTSLGESVSERLLKQKHNKIEKLFKRGVISSAMIIEAHRQLIEFTNTRFEFELGAVEALWNIYKIQGKLLNQKIEENI